MTSIPGIASLSLAMWLWMIFSRLLASGRRAVVGRLEACASRARREDRRRDSEPAPAEVM